MPVKISEVLYTGHDDPTLHDMIRTVTRSLNRDSENRVDSLRMEAANLILHSTDDDVERYIKEHVRIRSEMIAASYPDIKKEKTTTRLIAAGIAKHPKYQTVVAMCAVNASDSIAELRGTINMIRQWYKRKTSDLGSTSTTPF